MSEHFSSFRCGTCTLSLVQLTYGRAWGFRLVREPLAFCMRLLAVLYGVRQPPGISGGCAGCPRFLKTGLKERSALFNFLNNAVNPVFDRLLGLLVTPGEISRAKAAAAEAMTALSGADGGKGRRRPGAGVHGEEPI